MIWKLADAENNFREVFSRAIADGPQRIEIRGAEAVVVVSAVEFDRLTRPRTDFIAFLSHGPDLRQLELERDRTPMRDLGR